MSGALRVDRPWGYELVWEVTPEYVGKILHITRGHRVWVASDDRMSEPFILCSGRMLLVYEDERGDLREIALGPGLVHDIPVWTRHRMIVVEDSDVIATSVRDIEDRLRIEDC